jgi:hypothetical protein
MNPRLISRLPVTRIGALNTHPETSHLRALSALALACGDRTTLVEIGPTNGAVTVCLAEVLTHHQNSNLVVVGQLSEQTQEVIEFLKVGERVVCVDKAEEISGRLDLVFIGDPDKADGAEWAQANGARVICIYDVRTAERYRLPQFAPLMEASENLKLDPERSWNEFSTAVSFEQARRGMLVSEAKSWSPARGVIKTDTKPKKQEIAAPKDVKAVETKVSKPVKAVATKEPQSEEAPVSAVVEEQLPSVDLTPEVKKETKATVVKAEAAAVKPKKKAQFKKKKKA